MIQPYSICEKCGVGRLSPEPQHRPKDAHLTFPGQAMLHCYDFARHIIGCGNAVEAPPAAEVAAANKAAIDAKLSAEAEEKAQALKSAANIANAEAERLRAQRVNAYPLLSAAEVASMTPEAAATLQTQREQWDREHANAQEAENQGR